MKINLNENIRMYRKKMSLTQEQLAEAMGVSVATVSKWESGNISPDIERLAELADFFQTSVDVLIGYEWKKGSVEQCAERIHKLFSERNFDEGIVEARKAVQKYPNNYQILYESGLMLFLKAVSIDHVTNADYMQLSKEEYEYTIKVLEHSIELFDQNTDKSVSKEYIYQRIGIIYGLMGEKEKAIEFLEEHNACGINNSTISVYLNQIKEYDRAWKYASESFRQSLIDVWTNYQSILDVLFSTKRYDEAIEISKWAKDVCMSIAADDSSYFERAAVLIDAQIAMLYAYNGILKKKDYSAEIRTHLRQALLKAVHFDNNPDYIGKIKFFEYDLPELHDSFGENAIPLIAYVMKQCKPKQYSILTKIYNELIAELELSKDYLINEKSNAQKATQK